MNSAEECVLALNLPLGDVLAVLRVKEVYPGVERGDELFVADSLLWSVEPRACNDCGGGHRLLPLIHRDEVPLRFTRYKADAVDRFDKRRRSFRSSAQSSQRCGQWRK